MWFRSFTAAICRNCPNLDFNLRKSYAPSPRRFLREALLLAPTAPATLSAKKPLTGTFIASHCTELDVSIPTLCPCQDFLTLWKDAGPDLPILKQAKAARRAFPPIHHPISAIEF